MGCWKDDLEGPLFPAMLSDSLTGSPSERIAECSRMAAENSSDIFALQNFQVCFSGFRQVTMKKINKLKRKDHLLRFFNHNQYDAYESDSYRKYGCVHQSCYKYDPEEEDKPCPKIGGGGGTGGPANFDVYAIGEVL